MHIYQDAYTSKEKSLAHLFSYPFMETKLIVRRFQKRVEKETQLMIVALINIRIKTEDISRLTRIPEFHLPYYLKYFLLIYEV